MPGSASCSGGRIAVSQKRISDRMSAVSPTMQYVRRSLLQHSIIDGHINKQTWTCPAEYFSVTKITKMCTLPIRKRHALNKHAPGGCGNTILLIPGGPYQRHPVRRRITQRIRPCERRPMMHPEKLLITPSTCHHRPLSRGVSGPKKPLGHHFGANRAAPARQGFRG